MIRFGLGERKFNGEFCLNREEFLESLGSRCSLDAGMDPFSLLFAPLRCVLLPCQYLFYIFSIYKLISQLLKIKN